jgi:metal transporter CNNM
LPDSTLPLIIIINTFHTMRQSILTSGELQDQVTAAVTLLKSIGIQGLCHSTDEYESLPLCSTITSDQELDSVPPVEDAYFYITNIMAALFCVFCVAVVAGLFLGFMTMDEMDLLITIRASLDDDEKLQAKTVLPVVQQYHRLLVTLLIMNALAYETLPLFLDVLVPTWVAIVLSVTLILIFGEMIPSAIFTGPHQLYLAAQMTPMVKFFMFILYPLAGPLGMLLDHLVSDEEEGYNRTELSALVRIQYEENIATKAQRKNRFVGKLETWKALKMDIMEAVEARAENKVGVAGEVPEIPFTEQLSPPLHHSEVIMVEGALNLKTKVAMDVYTPMRKIFALPEDFILDKDNIMRIYSQGYSRIPVFRKNMEYDQDQSAVLGYVFTRNLIALDWDDEREVSTLPLQRPVCVSPRMNLVNLLKVLQTGGSHMVFVCARPDVANKVLEAEDDLPIPSEAGFMGIVTLDDVLECVLQDRIYDELDIKDRDRASATLTLWAASTLQRFMKKKGDQLRARTHSIKSQESMVNNDEALEDTLNTPTSETPLLGQGDKRFAYNGALKRSSVSKAGEMA